MKLITTLFLFVVSFSALSATVVCGGKVETIAMHANDKLMIKLDSMNTSVFVCTLNETWTVNGTGYTTSPETCSAMLSMFMHVKAADLEFNSIWFDGDDVPTSCRTWESWKTANIRALSY